MKKDERFPVLAVKLVLEPLTSELAKELGPSIADHCFTRHGQIRDEMTSIQVRLREKPQIVTIQMAADSTVPTAVLRHVRIPLLTITKRELDGDAPPTQTKKVGPQAATLRVTISALVDPAEKEHREFFCRHINAFLLFSFDPEERDLFADMRADEVDEDDDEDGDDAPELEGMAPSPDPDAGDVLDEQPTKRMKAAKPRLVKGNDAAKDTGAIACQVCGGPDATETTKPLNGLPTGVLACDDCRKAVKQRQVGVSRNEDGTLHITDGRRREALA